ncbi:hypothetical protein H4219_003603 [Mycoemilia scoparia]|uniref:Amino acid transporter transmembrane domain-containing protein n=1 Tax=Mycoemilia scoparia TaxID=417184 RepID=A0A9W8DSE3_9FUNG|nr:hypothetical protein H4219_003603 [Mycoemilia scoparia]
MEPSIHELNSIYNYWEGGSDEEDAQSSRTLQRIPVDYDDDDDTMSVTSNTMLLDDADVDDESEGASTPRTLRGFEEGGDGDNGLKIGEPGEHKASNLSTYFNIVCIVAGTGILQLPYALSEGGWSAVFLIALAALMSNFTANATVRCLYYKDGIRLDGYSDVAYEAFGSKGRKFVSFFKSATLTAASSLFIVLTATNITQLLQDTSFAHLSIGFWIKVCVVFAWTPLVIKKSIHEVAILSMFSTLSTVVMVIVVVYICGRDIVARENMPDLTAIDIKKIPTALSSIFFSYGGNFVFPEVEGGMKYPKSFERVQGSASITVFLMYALVAVMGYAAYASDTKSPVFLNMKSGPLLIIANSMVTAHAILTAPIMMASVCMNLEQDLNVVPVTRPRSEQKIRRFLFRTFMMLVVFCLAYYCPYFDDLVQLIGAFAESLLVFVFPAMFYLILQSKKGPLSIFTWAWCSLVILVGLYCCTAGTWSGITSLISHIQNAKPSKG